MEMRFYFAPMEGITGYVYRGVHHRFFPGMDKYFSPFLTAASGKSAASREIRDLLPEKNRGYTLVPQILTNRAADFAELCGRLSSYGYREVNLNLGCPSGTVVSKKRGAGFLGFPEELDAFLDEIFQKTELEISIKTRIGVSEPEEFGRILEIYNRYPLKELIIHPRVREDFYKNTPDWDTFALALEASRAPVCYNGDLFTKAAYERFRERFPQTENAMLGRGLLRNPCLVREIRGTDCLDKVRLLAFHDALCEEYEGVLSGDRNVLFKMKELWFYMGSLFEDSKKYLKRIKKSQKLAQYRETVRELFAERELVREEEDGGDISFSPKDGA